MKRALSLVALSVLALSAWACGDKRVVMAGSSTTPGAQPAIVIGGLEDTRDDFDDHEGKKSALLEIRNNLDRSVSIDLVGSIHRDVTVNDARSERVVLPRGSYTMRASAGALDPAKTSISLEKDHLYVITIYYSR